MSVRDKGWPWTVLDLTKAPATTAEVRRAYARKLKTIDQATDIAGFEALREAYETGLLRVEQSARRKAAKAAAKAAERGLYDKPDVEEAGEAEASPPPAQDPGAQLPTLVSGLPEILTRTEAQPSVAEQLQLLLAQLHENNILLSANQRILLLLQDEDFRTPEHDATLRLELSDYVLSQLLFNHLNQPYLRHPGLSAEVLRALDARFGWLSDYTAFREDFGENPDLLDAMVDAAELERRPSVQHSGDSVPIRGSRLYVVLGALALFILWAKMGDFARSAEPHSAMRILSQALNILGPGALLAGVSYVLYDAIKAQASRRTAVLGTVWAGLGFMILVLPVGILPITWNLLPIWGNLTIAAGVGYSALWLGRKALALLNRLRQKS